jgi:heat shock protein HslJ
MTTRTACAEDVMLREADFLAALEKAKSYELAGGSLTLLAGDEAVARLESSVRPG